MLFHFGGVLPYALVWLLTCRGRRSRVATQWFEALGVVLSAVSYQFMGSYLPLEGGAHLVVLLALTFGLVGRSIFVPSNARLTLGLCLIIGAPLIIVFYFRFLGMGPELLETYNRLSSEMIQRSATPMSVEGHASAAAMGLAAWWSLTCILCTSTSSVIYGLREQTRRALQLGQYTLLQKIGEGGMGAVYQAQHAMLRRPTAIKLLAPQRAGGTNILRFEREVQLTAELSHPNTVTVFDYGRTPEGLFYYAMELLDGATLDTIVDVDGALPEGRVIHLVKQIAGALSEAHNHGLIHRDIKPGNVILCERGGIQDTAKVVDFGLVKPIENDPAAPELTQANIVTGTPLYMSPEMIREPDAVDARSDIYSLGALTYFLITGTHVFGGNTTVEVCGHHLHSPPEKPSVRSGNAVTPELEGLILECLAKSPEDRPKSMQKLLSRLSGITPPAPWTLLDAQKWWSKHANLITKVGTLSTPDSPNNTINIDLSARA